MHFGNGRFGGAAILAAVTMALLSAGQAQAQCRGGQQRGPSGTALQRTPMSPLMQQRQNPVLTTMLRQQQSTLLTTLQLQQQYALLTALRQQQQQTAVLNAALLQLRQQNAQLIAAQQQQQQNPRLRGVLNPGQ